MKTAIAFLTKDKTELSRRTVELLLDQPFDLWWIDGSTTEEGALLVSDYPQIAAAHEHIFGGPDAAVAYALTWMLKDKSYDFIGLCENDVLLQPDWFDCAMALFEIGRLDGLEVGAVSPRAYEDRVLIQREGYAVMHNLGWGCQIMTRQAAHLALANLRTGWTSENRRTFCNLSSIDIGSYWAFRGAEHQLCADWGNDRMLAAHGLASLALIPSPAEMIGQVPPLAEQGLTLATGPVEARRDDQAFVRYVETTRRIRDGELHLPSSRIYRDDQAVSVYFPHQLGVLDAVFEGDWRLKWAQGFGPFAWQAGKSHWLQAKDETVRSVEPTLIVMISGPCEFLVSGGETGGQVSVEDLRSGYSVSPTLQADSKGGHIMGLVCPSGVSRRALRLTMLSPGTVFYGIKCREPQPETAWAGFDHSVLPPV